MESRKGWEKIERGRERRRGEWKEVMFWNVAELSNKDRDLWEGLKEWNVIVLSETWIEDKGWNRWRERLPKRLIYIRSGR